MLCPVLADYRAVSADCIQEALLSIDANKENLKQMWDVHKC